MARKKHLINVHTSTGTTAPTGASLYLGEIAVQHTPDDPALWIKVGSAETSTEYEKFIGKTEIINLLEDTKILGSGYTYSGLPYINSSTTIADAFSAITKELFDDEQVIAEAFNDLNDRVNELSGATEESIIELNERIDELSAATEDGLIDYIRENEEVTAAALNNLNERLGTVETQLTGDYIPLTGYELASGTSEEELALSEEDTVNEAFGKLQKQMLDNEEAIAAGLNDLNTRLDNVDEIIAHNTGITQLSGAVSSLSAATDGMRNTIESEISDIWDNFDNFTYTSTTNSLSAATTSIGRSTLTINLNGVQQGKYTPLSGNTTINLTAATEVTGADVLLTGYELATGSTEEELAIVATDTVNEAFGKIQKQNYDNEAIIAGSLNDLDERILVLEQNSGSSEELEILSGVVITLDDRVTAIEISGSSSEELYELSGAVVTNEYDIDILSAAVVSKEYVIAHALNDLNERVGNTLQIVCGSTYIMASAKSGGSDAKMQTITAIQQNVETASASGQGLADAYDVKQYVDGIISSSVNYKGATATLPASSTAGDMYITTAQIILTAEQSATEAAQTAETGDFIIARESGKWDVIQKNLDGAIVGNLTADTLTLGDGSHAVKSLANGTHGQILAISGASNTPTWITANLNDTATTEAGHYTPTTSASTKGTTAATTNFVKGIRIDSKNHVIDVVTGTVVTAQTQLSAATTGTGNVMTDITVNDHQITKNMGMTIPSWATASTKPSYTLDEVSDGTTRKLSDYALSASVTALSAATTAHTGNGDIHVTSAQKTAWTDGANSGASAYTLVNNLSAVTVTGVSAGGTNVTVTNKVAAIPSASTSNFGVVKTGDFITNTNGTISVATGTTNTTVARGDQFLGVSGVAATNEADIVVLSGMISDCKILGPEYTYSGLSYINSSTTIANAFSALTKEMIDDEKVISNAFNDLNDRVLELSGNVETNEGDIQDLSDDIQGLSGNIQGLSGDIQGLSSTTENLDTRVVNLEGKGNAKVFYGTCDTAAGTGAKVVSCPSFTSADLDNGTMLLVKFANTNTADVADLTLNVNGTGAVDIKKVYNYATSNLSNVGELRGIVHQFVYWEGSSSAHWYLVGVDYNTNTTYSNMSQDNIDAGTSNTGMRIAPKLLRDNFYTEDEVDALISATTEIPTLYIGDSVVPLTTEQKTHNSEILSGLVGTCLHKEVKFVDVSDSDSESVVVFNTVVDMGSDSYMIDFSRFIGLAGTKAYQSFFCTVSSGNLLWSNATSVNFLLSDSISTNIQTDKTSDTKMASPKAVYEEVHPEIETTQPQGGFAPNVFYNLGTISGSVTFTLATPTDANIVNHYYWTFDADSTAPTITWPSGISWYGGSSPTINANKHYEISIINNIAVYMEV